MAPAEQRAIVLAMENEKLRAENAGLIMCMDALTEVSFHLCRRHGETGLAGILDKLSSQIQEYRERAHG